MENIYFYSTILASIVGLVMAILLAGLQIRSSEGLQQYNRSRWCLVCASAIFGVLNLLEVSLDGGAGEDTGSFAGCLSIVIGSLLAMFFTMTVLAFIQPQIVHRKQILVQLAVIVPPGILLILLRLFAPESVFKPYFLLMLAAYLLLMVLYTRLFVRNYRTFKEQMLAFYEQEDLVGQLQWINWTFWLALGVGVASLLFLVDALWVESFLNLLFSLFFLLLGVFFVNYRPYALLVDRAVKKDAEPKAAVKADEMAPLENEDTLRQAIDTWMATKGYLDNSKSVDDIASDMNVYYPALRDYIQRTTGQDFRTWRTRLRVEEAQRILAAQPGIPVSHVATLAGFNDRAYFYRTFQKVTGMSVPAYLESCRV